MDTIQAVRWCIFLAGVALLLARDWAVRAAGVLVMAGAAIHGLGWPGFAALAAVIVTLGLYLLMFARVFGRGAASSGQLETPDSEDLATAEPVVCLQCGATIPTGESACPRCGWTYAGTQPAGDSPAR